MQSQGIEGSKRQKEDQAGGKRRATSDLPWDAFGLQRRMSLFPVGFLWVPVTSWSSAFHLRLAGVALPLPFGIFGSYLGEGRSDLLKWVLVFAVHSVRPSDIKFVAAMGNVETVSISRRRRWESGFGTRSLRMNSW